MSLSKAHIIAELQKQILPLQGYKPTPGNSVFDAGLGPLGHAFPNAVFPLSAVHEFFCSSTEQASASAGFISGILSAIMRQSGVSLWVSSSRMIFPPALQLFGIEPDKIIFVDVRNEKERLWVLEEALKCDGLSAVIGEMQEISFTASRRLQLAVEKSRVTGFVIRRNPKNMATACVTRWKIAPLPGEMVDDLPGVGFPRWNVELIKVRNGKPGTWQLGWMGGRFRHVTKMLALETGQQRKAV